MHRLAERCGVMAISMVWVATLFVFALNLYAGLTQGQEERTLAAILAVMGAIPITCLIATCSCIARYTDQSRRAR